MSLRVATINDVEALTAVHVIAMPMDPNFPYLFPNVSDYQDEYSEFTKDSITSTLSVPDGHSSTLLVEISDLSELSKKRIVAFATWELLDSSGTSGQDLLGQHPNHGSEDSNKSPALIWQYLPNARWDAYILAANQARLRIDEERYGKQQLFLSEMVVHPEYQRQGFGKLLMQWGIRKAIQEHWAITTFASVPGRSLYESFGLREIDSVRTQVKGEDEYIDNPILAMDAPT